MIEWRLIDTAPKDGTRVMLWRGFPQYGDWDEMVIAEWHGDEWQWPADRATTHGEWSQDDLEDGFSQANGFTHWLPLPEPPQ